MTPGCLLDEFFPKPPPARQVHMIAWIYAPFRPLEYSGAHVPDSLPLTRELSSHIQSLALSCEGVMRSLSSNSKSSAHSRATEPERIIAPVMSKKLSRITRERIPAIHDAIKSLQTDIKFECPTTFIDLPFPSPLSPSTIRFQVKKPKNFHYFKYMGRTAFKELEVKVKNELCKKMKSGAYLYGCAGSGKSHLLAALAVKLIQEGKRVIYIPDCGELVSNFERTIRIALCFAFYDDPEAYSIIESACDAAALLTFAEGNTDGCLIVDELDTLEIRPNDPHPNATGRARELLIRMASSHVFIHSSSPNIPLAISIGPRASVTTVVVLAPAMDENEATHWFNHYAKSLPKFSPDEKNLIKSLTGHVPLLLRPLFQFQKVKIDQIQFEEENFDQIQFEEEKFDQIQFLQSEELVQVRMDIIDFFKEKMTELHDTPTLNEYLSLMRGFLQNIPIFYHDKALYDQRYFYIREGCAYYTCGVAAEALAWLLGVYSFDDFNHKLWYSVVKETTNPVVRGFIAEHICLKRISINGLDKVRKEFKGMEAVQFTDKPYWGQQITSKSPCRLYYPASYSFPCIDAIIHLLEFESKEAHLFPIQITLNKVHQDAETDFYTRWWTSMKNDLEYEDFTVTSTFIWIGMEASNSEVKKARFRKTRRGDKEVEPEHESLYVNISQIDPTLANYLSQK
ncbi:hypothetical protein CPB86DRAFT_282444 [Serendipita vermifera]|nr:hypothetical protein CPB86DRAFT_282444 [Serendipita vermifera]